MFNGPIINLAFNSIKVQLRHNLKQLKPYAKHFQFHKGTIKAPKCDYRDSVPRTFNSIKVQLRR